MTNPHLDQAKEWAVHHAHTELVLEGSAARVIQSLPDQWMDVEKVRDLRESLIESVSEMPSIPEQTIREIIRDLVDEYIEWIDDILPAPPLPTLAELIEAGNDPKQYQWMQADATGINAGRVVIVSFTNYLAKGLSSSGRQTLYDFEDITPRPDLPPMKWPGSGDAPTVAEQENVTPDQQVNSSESPKSSLPRPEDVPEGEAWLVKHDGHECVGIRADYDSRPWCTTRIGGRQFNYSRYCRDSDVTLVSRLVPEVAP